ncbi:DUF4123 domain-containing protein [Burkholderia sp. 3C]
MDATVSIIDQLSHQFARTGTRAIFVDPALGDPLAEWRNRDDLNIHSLRLPEPKVVRSAWPYLLEIPSDSSLAAELVRVSVSVAMTEAIEWQRGEGVCRSICGWLSCSGDIRHLADALSHKAVLTSNDTESKLFRFYDPRVLTHLFRYLRASQFFSGLPVLRHWTFLNTDAERVTLSPDGAPESPAPVWFMTREQREGIGSIEMVNRVLRGVGAHVDRSKEVDAALSRCRTHYGWTDPDDLIAFAVVALRCHPRFDEHPRIQARIAELHGKGELFAEWADGVEEGTWRNIAIELNPIHTRGQT